MPARIRGLYELLISETLDAQLREPGLRLVPSRSELGAAEVSDRIALHISRLIQRALDDVPDDRRVATGLALARKILEQIGAQIDETVVAGEAPIERESVLRALAERLPDGQPEKIFSPLIPLLDTALLTNSPGEPVVGSQVKAEIHSADRIDVVMAFVRRSGINPMLDSLRRHTSAGRPLRVLTTTYTGSTETRALDDLASAGAALRVSYDTSTTRLHAKAWIFHRGSGFSTAYIGSSNLTHSAQVSGLEWNLRVSGARNPAVIAKMSGVFESYWNSGDFVPYEREEFVSRIAHSPGAQPSILLSPIELRPEPFQERLLEQIAASRERGFHRNLLASATGTGKTVMAAIDYARLIPSLPRARLLFVAHRKEILLQSLATFRYALRAQDFGELWVDGQKPRRFEHVFASIQSLDSAGLANLAPDHFDVVIVDEFHHAAAPTYQNLLEHVRPVELLGLTATPERSDGLPVLSWFDNRIAAELRLWDAIDQHRLSPFVYYGVADGLDLRDIPWRRGFGYDTQALSNLYTSNEAWARLVLKQVRDRVDEPLAMRALGFCVSVEHARFMARVFSEAGLRATAIWADSPTEERQAALRALASGATQVVFSVDLFNEGIDIPVVDTLLMLRPTDSPTLFLQQLGRGLRKTFGKTVCTVLDFVGHHRKEFRFDRRFRALLGGSRKDLVGQVQGGFPFLPAGCQMYLDPVATDVVLANVRASVPARWTSKVEELRQLAPRGGAWTLLRYLDEAGLSSEDLYAGQKGWSDLLEEAGLPTLAEGPHEGALRRACGRLLHIDDAERIDAYRRIISAEEPPRLDHLDERTRRYCRMLLASLSDQVVDKATTVEQGFALLWQHPQVRREVADLLDVVGGRIDRVHRALATNIEVPLQVHARYSRLEILAAFGIGEGAQVAPWQTGVYWAAEARADLLAFTLDKTSGQFSPTTRYRDYAISRELIHWESQGVTREDSDTGQRYQRHAEMGTSVILFARLRADDRAFWCLGPAAYVTHESERPMAVTWRLAVPLPGDLFASFAAAVA